MNKTYLDKVVKQIADETVSIGGNFLTTPFYSPLPLATTNFSYSTLPFSPHYSFFEEYVIEVYGLTNRESKYVWKQYKERIINRF